MHNKVWGYTEILPKKRQINPSNFLQLFYLATCEVNERYACTRVCYDARSQTVAYLAFTTKTAPQQRLNFHTCNYPGLEFISKGKISSVNENNLPRAVLNFCLRPPFFQFPLENVLTGRLTGRICSCALELSADNFQ